MSLVLERSAHANFERRLRTITAAGVALPDEIVALQKRLDGFRGSVGATACLDRLAQAIITGDTVADLPLLWAAALAEGSQDNHVRQTVEGTIRAAVNTEIRAVYAAHARTAWTELAAVFNSNAAAFTKAAKAVDVESPAELIVGTTKAVQDAWTGATTHAARMTSLLPALTAAASLAGACNDKGKAEGSYLEPEGTLGPDVALALVVDTNNMDRQELWAAWDTESTERTQAAQANNAGPYSTPTVTPSRCGRWSALYRLGATIQAIDNLDHYISYSRNEPLPQSNDPLTVG